MRLASLSAGLLLVLCAGAARADVCFTVLDKGGKVLHQSRKAPVDMSRPISATLYDSFPGASVMVFGRSDEQCEELRGKTVVAAPAPARRRTRM
ncbi:hypothetical protein GT347_10800 [Xylophilus rhododendri]|uniref:Uncharacterized protein n=1 Tax=Xylophilus rhododendri TaxID=2697032 RepID=A0A857J3D9_9BURK|nr:hypothetical protein [Xylophilus rhododendri]QHI98440.1 hypothetical protein GT347_10800 [Xylophilus rhododendri]